jgi:hypothetical protein
VLGDLAVAILPLFFGLPGLLALLPLTPGWGWLPRAAVGVALGMAEVVLLAWGGNALLGLPLDARLAWGAWALATLAGAAAAWAGRRAWMPLARPRLRWRHAALALILVSATLLVTRPHWGYALPLHQDEWGHLSAAKAMVDQARVRILDPHYGLWVVPQDAEVAFHVALAISQLATGAGWIALMLSWPAMVMALLVVTAFCAGEREGYGVEAALLVALLPTSLRVLGPQYVVPLALGLVFIPATFLLFAGPHPRRAMPMVALMMVFLFFAHPQSAAAAGILMGTYAVLTARARPWRAAALLALALFPFVAGTLLFPKITGSDDVLQATSNLPVPEFLSLFGWAPMLLFLAGAFATFLAPSSERLAWVATSFAHLLLIVLFLLFHVGQSNLFDRAWMHGMLTMSMTGGYALHLLRARLPLPTLTRAGVALLAALLVVGLAVPAQAAREAEGYHVLSPDDYATALWVRDHVPPEGQRALVDPWQGDAWSTVAGIHVVAAQPLGVDSGGLRSAPYGSATAALRLLEKNASDERTLQRLNVTLIVTDRHVENQNFTQAHPGVWARVRPALRS